MQTRWHEVFFDTCTVSDFVKGHPKVLARGKATPPILDAFFSAFATLPFDEAAAAIRAALKAQGQPIGAYDVLIDGTGLARGLVVITSNVGEFKRVSGLQIEDWR